MCLATFYGQSLLRIVYVILCMLGVECLVTYYGSILAGCRECEECMLNVSRVFHSLFVLFLVLHVCAPHVLHITVTALISCGLSRGISHGILRLHPTVH